MAKKRKVAYRKRQQNKFSMFLVALVVLMIMVVVAIDRVELQRKIDEQTAQIAELQVQKEAEEVRAAEIEEYRKYTQTKRYVEEVAKDKLGLVYEGEILFKEEN
ncbi:MAG: septum formation initiator family protein [Lachnospiraceae bacterium]|nr:septum formation initiator family protein [Lachnospiraceae bacterium]